MTDILRPSQQDILDNLPDSLRDNFAFTGGTAIAAFFLEHRLSDDLDFVALEEGQPVPFSDIEGILKDRYTITFKNKHYDRCIFHLDTGEDPVKIEFVPLYFPRLNPTKTIAGLAVESLEDLTANKIIALTDRFEIKDFADLFFIARKTGWDFLKMIQLATAKNPMPYEYTVQLQRIAQHPEGLQHLHFVRPVAAETIITFFQDAEAALKKSVQADIESSDPNNGAAGA